MRKVLMLIIFFIVLLSSIGIYLFSDDSPKEVIYDDNGNLVFNKSSPYYEYVENFSSDEMIQKYVDSMYVSNDNPDYLISVYGDGVCINKYLGKEKSVFIPEEIDGKPVLKLGNYYLETDFGFRAYSSFCFTRIESIYLPSKLKEIVNPTFFQINQLEMYPEDGWCDVGEVDNSLKNITVSKDNPYYISICGTLFSKTSYKVLCSPQLPYYR